MTTHPGAFKKQLSHYHEREHKFISKTENRTELIFKLNPGRVKVILDIFKIIYYTGSGYQYLLKYYNKNFSNILNKHSTNLWTMFVPLLYIH